MHDVAQAITGLAHEVRALVHAVSSNLPRAATACDLHKTEERIMSAIKDFSDKVDAAFEEIGTSVDGVQSDVTALKAKIDELQNSSGTVTPEDQALLDQIQARATSLAEKVKTLDAATETPPTA